MLAARRVVPERMDAPDLPPADHFRALNGLARLNAVSRPLAGVTEVVRRVARKLPRPVRVLDVACGGGDNLGRLLRWARRSGVAVEGCGCDLSKIALTHAALFAELADWRVCDVLREPLPSGFDVLTCSLFLHHLSDADATALLAKMRDAAGSAVVANDLVRGPVGLGLVWAGSRLLSRSKVVHFDGPASVRAAFTPTELRALATAAGMGGAAVRTVFPCRMVLTWERR